MKGLSALCALFALDAVIGLAQQNNMYSLKHWNGGGIAVDVVTLIVCLIFGPALWQMAKRRALFRALDAMEAHEQGLITEADRDARVMSELRDFR